MADVIVDRPGEVHWFAGHGPLTVVGDCPHDCPHNGVSVIAWGPDNEHYTLDECHTCGCRGWCAEYVSGEPDRPRMRWHGWRQVKR